MYFNFNIENVIYIYLYICASLLLFHIGYILRLKSRRKRTEKRAKKWEGEIKRQMKRLKKGRGVELAHQKQMRKQLVKSNGLLAYGTALEQISPKEREFLMRYIQENQTTLQYLALQYRKKDSVDRAYFAYLISKYQIHSEEEFLPIMEILISFLEHSTVYCRENVLNALYALGNCQAVENALQILNDRGWFHHRKLLSDGLMTFTGDKEKLAARLWSHNTQWNVNIMVAVIQFITSFSDEYRAIFFPIIKDQDVDLEIQLAILRYYRRHIYRPIKPILFSFLKGDIKDENLMIVSAFVLGQYPGKDTICVLKHALFHSNWHIRYNAASSLVGMGTTLEELHDILNGKDKYAREILNYMIAESG